MANIIIFFNAYFFIQTIFVLSDIYNIRKNDNTKTLRISFPQQHIY